LNIKSSILPYLNPTNTQKARIETTEEICVAYVWKVEFVPIKVPVAFPLVLIHDVLEELSYVGVVRVCGELKMSTVPQEGRKLY